MNIHWFCETLPGHHANMGMVFAGISTVWKILMHSIPMLNPNTSKCSRIIWSLQE